MIETDDAAHCTQWCISEASLFLSRVSYATRLLRPGHGAPPSKVWFYFPCFILSMHVLLPRTLQHNGFLWFDRPSLYFCAVRTEVESRGFSDSFAMAISGIRQAMMNLSF
jgi:hypothetical protein